MLLTLEDQFSRIHAVRWKVMNLVFIKSIIFIIIAVELTVMLFVYAKKHQNVIYEGRSGQRVVYRLFFYDDSYRALDTALDWLKKRAMPEDIVTSSMPHWVYLRTGLKAVMPPFEVNPVKAQMLLDTVPVRYLFLEDGLALDITKYTSPLIQNFSERWRQVYSDSIIANSDGKSEGRLAIYQRTMDSIVRP
jgi:hypothetical protein